MIDRLLKRYAYMKTIKMSKRNMNSISEKSQIQCLKDIKKYRFLSFEDHANYYLETIANTIRKYDYIALLCVYENYIVNKYDIFYYRNHRELEVLIGMISKYGSRLKNDSISKHIHSLPRKEIIVKLEINLRKYTNIFLINEQFSNLSNYYTSNYNNPQTVLKFKTNYIRNEGVGKQFLDYIKEILIIFDSKSSKNHVNKLSQFTDAFIDLMNKPSERNSRLYSKISNIILKLKLPFLDLFGIDILDRKNLLKTYYYCFFTKKIKYMLAVMNFHLASFYTSSELIDIFGFSNTDDINKLALSPGRESINNIWLDNPVWSKPFLKIDDKDYLYPISNSPLTFIENMIECILDEEDKELFQRIKTQQFLEQKILQFFEIKYPSLVYYANLKFRENNKQYETDLLIIHKNTAMIIESKGHSLTKKARMGDEKRIDDRIEKIIEKGALQAERLKRVIQTRKDINPFQLNGKNIELDFSQIDEVLTLSVSIEWLIFFSTVMNSLRMKYSISEGHVHCSLTELDIVVDTLNDMDQFIYYFYKRSFLEKKNYPIKADELDLFCHFLGKGFRFNKNHEGMIDITGEFDRHPLSNYLLGKYNLAFHDNDFLKKMREDNPKQDFLLSSKFIRKHIEYLEKEKCENVLVTGYFKTIPPEEQKFIESKVMMQVREKNDKISISKYLVDYFSPSLIIVVMDNTIANYPHVLNQIKENITDKDKNQLGFVIVFYKLVERCISIELINYAI